MMWDALRHLAERCDVLTYEFEMLDSTVWCRYRDLPAPSRERTLLRISKSILKRDSSANKRPSHRGTLRGRDF